MQRECRMAKPPSAGDDGQIGETYATTLLRIILGQRGPPAARRPPKLPLILVSLAAHIRCGRKPLSFLGGAGARLRVVPVVLVVVTFPVKVGWKRAWVTASKPEASLMSVGSLNAVPPKLLPIGIPSTSAAGTCTIGYPGGPASPELAKRKWS